MQSVPRIDKKKEVDLAALEGKIRPEVLEEMKTPLHFRSISSDELNRRIDEQEKAVQTKQTTAVALPPVPVVRPVEITRPVVAPPKKLVLQNEPASSAESGESSNTNSLQSQMQKAKEMEESFIEENVYK